MAGRPPTELSVLLEDTKRQFFYLVYILNWRPFSNVVEFFDYLFEEMSKTVGIRIRVTPGQWQTRKDKWDKEWNMGHGGPSDAVFAKLDELHLWYDGTKKTLNLPLGAIALEPQSTASRYHRSKEEDLYLECNTNKGRLRFEALAAADGSATPDVLPSDLRAGSFSWPSEAMPTFSDFQDPLPFADVSILDSKQIAAQTPPATHHNKPDEYKTHQLFGDNHGHTPTKTSPPAGVFTHLPEYVSLQEIESTPPSVPSNTKLTIRPLEQYSSKSPSSPEESAKVDRKSRRKRTQTARLHSPPRQRR